MRLWLVLAWVLACFSDPSWASVAVLLALFILFFATR